METLSITNMNLLTRLIRQHKKDQIPFVKQQFIRELVHKEPEESITKRDILNAILQKNEKELCRDDDDNFQLRRRKSRKRGRKSRKK